MNKIHEWTNTLLIVVVAILVLVGGNQSVPSDKSVGGQGTRFPHGISAATSTLPSNGGLIVGNNGNESVNTSFGICYLDPSAATITASSSITIDCQATRDWDANTGVGPLPLTGASGVASVRENDFVQVTLSTTTAGSLQGGATGGTSTFGGLILQGASASSTPGFITLRLLNNTGTTFTWSTQSGTASGTAYYKSLRSSNP